MLQQYVALKSSLRIVPCNITFKVMLHDDSQRRFQALLCVALEQCCDHSKQCRNSVVMLCCTKKSSLPIFPCNRHHHLYSRGTLHIKGDIKLDDSQWRATRNYNIIATLFRMVATFFQQCNAALGWKSLLLTVPCRWCYKVRWPPPPVWTRHSQCKPLPAVNIQLNIQCRKRHFH